MVETNTELQYWNDFNIFSDPELGWSLRNNSYFKHFEFSLLTQFSISGRLKPGFNSHGIQIQIPTKSLLPKPDSQNKYGIGMDPNN